MAIIVNNAPSESFEALKNQARLYHHELIDRDDKGNQHHHLPHKVFSISVSDLADDKDLSSAVQIAWRYILENSSGHKFIAEVGINEGEHDLHMVNTGRHVNNFLRIYKDLAQHHRVEENDYEVNLIQIMPLYVMAVWAKGEDHEFFIPVGPVNSRFSANQVYEYKEFTGILQELAKNHMAVFATDELTKIEGIGSKIAELLKLAGYSSFEAVARAQVSELEEVLREGGARYNLADAGTWPEQARLAGEERWEELEKLQKILKGGKR